MVCRRHFCFCCQNHKHERVKLQTHATLDSQPRHNYTTANADQNGIYSHTKSQLPTSITSFCFWQCWCFANFIAARDPGRPGFQRVMSYMYGPGGSSYGTAMDGFTDSLDAASIHASAILECKSGRLWMASFCFHRKGHIMQISKMGHCTPCKILPASLETTTASHSMPSCALIFPRNLV